MRWQGQGLSSAPLAVCLCRPSMAPAMHHTAVRLLLPPTSALETYSSGSACGCPWSTLGTCDQARAEVYVQAP